MSEHQANRISNPNHELSIPADLREWLIDEMMKASTDAANHSLTSQSSKLARVNAEIDQLDVTAHLIDELQSMRDVSCSVRDIHDLMMDEMRSSTLRINQSNSQLNSLIVDLGLEDCVHSDELASLAHAAFHLNCSNVDNTSLMQAITHYYLNAPNDFKVSNDEHASAIDEQDVVECLQQHARLESVHSSHDARTHQRSNTRQPQLPSIAQMQAELAAFEQKRADYQKRLALQSAHCQQLGVADTSYSWATINALNDTIKSKSQLRDTLSHELVELNELPSDPVLARERIDKEWAEVARMEQELERAIQSFGTL